MIVDGDTLIVITGASGGGAQSTIEPLPDGFRFNGTIGLPITTTGCYASVTYTDLSFTFDPSGRLLGKGRGQLTTAVTDVASSVPVTMSLTGVADTVSPALALSPLGPLTDPFTSFRVVSSEPLPPLTAFAALRAASGDVVVLTPSVGGASSLSVFGFAKPDVVLRFGEQYSVEIAGTSDFAGNSAVPAGSLAFETAPAPPLVAADGFESVTGTTLGGAQVLSGATEPILSGSRSLYIPPVPSIGASGPATQLALRLTVPPGGAGVLFTYRTVNPGTASSATFLVGSVGHSYVSYSPPLGGGMTTTATIGGSQVTLGPVGTATIPFAPDATGEIILERVIPAASPCGLNPPASGIIIDDLSVVR
jgi:hypothetical protein